MHLDKFDLNLLVALDALLTEKHVTRAAEKLFVSQPAMSAALSKLRSYFDDQLLIKVGPGLELTPRAQDLLGDVRELLFRIKATLRTEPTFDPSTDAREMRVLMSDYVGSVFAPALTRGLLSDAPHVQCQVERVTLDSLIRIDHGVVDFCITVEQRDGFTGVNDFASLKSELLFEDEFVVVSDAGLTSEEPLTLESFQDLPYVEVRFARAVFSVIEAATRQQGLHLRPRVVMPSFTEAAALLPGTRMAAIVPRHLARMLAPVFGLVIRKVPMPLPPLRETLVWHQRNDADPAHRWFRAYLHKVAAGIAR